MSKKAEYPPVSRARAPHSEEDKKNTGDSDGKRDAGAEASAEHACGNTEEDAEEEKPEEEEKPGCRLWLEVLPSKGGMLLAVLMAEIMTEGLTPTQINILGNFVSAVGSLISYKASREER